MKPRIDEMTVRVTPRPGYDYERNRIVEIQVSVRARSHVFVHTLATGSFDSEFSVMLDEIKKEIERVVREKDAQSGEVAPTFREAAHDPEYDPRGPEPSVAYRPLNYGV